MPNSMPCNHASDTCLTTPELQFDWDTVQTVFLDLDGTLLDLHFDNHFWHEHLPERYAQQKGRSPVEARALISTHIKEIEGSLSYYCLDYWRDFLELDLVALKQEIAGRIALRPEAENFLTYLHTLGKNVILLTNAHPDSIALKFRQIPIQHHFQRIISAHSLGIAKENPFFWSTLQGIQPFKSARTLFIDDNLQVLCNAKQQGVRYLLTIAQPDSTLPARQSDDFPALDCFRQLMNGTVSTQLP